LNPHIPTKGAFAVSTAELEPTIIPVTPEAQDQTDQANPAGQAPEAAAEPAEETQATTEETKPAAEETPAAGEETKPQADETPKEPPVPLPLQETREQIAQRIYDEQMDALKGEIADLAVQMAEHQAELTNLKKDYKEKVRDLAALRERGAQLDEECYPLFDVPPAVKPADAAPAPAYKSLLVKELGFTEKEVEALGQVDVFTIGDLQTRIDRLGTRWTDAMPGYSEEFRGRTSDLFFEFFKTHPVDQPTPAPEATETPSDPQPASQEGEAMPPNAVERKRIRLLEDIKLPEGVTWHEGEIITAYVDEFGEVFAVRYLGDKLDEVWLEPTEYEEADANNDAGPTAQEPPEGDELAQLEAGEAVGVFDAEPEEEEDDQADCIPLPKPVRKRTAKGKKAKSRRGAK
jgi:hypothetical protein